MKLKIDLCYLMNEKCKNVMRKFKQEYVLAKRDKYLMAESDINDNELIFKKDSYYPVLSITEDLAFVQHYEIVYKYDDIGTPSIIFVEMTSRDKYFYSEKEMRKLKLEQIDNK